MGRFLLLQLLLIPIAIAQNQTLLVSGTSDLKVLSHRWTRTHRVTSTNHSNLPPPPAISMTASASRTAQKADRLNDNGSPRDPAPETLDGRAATLEKIARESRIPQSKVLGGFTYTVKLKNESSKQADVVFWEYQFINGDSSEVTRRQFLCALDLKPGKEKELLAFTMSGPGKVVSADGLEKAMKPSQEKVLINRVEYSDGTIWKREGWKFAEIRLNYLNAMATPWSEMCRSL